MTCLEYYRNIQVIMHVSSFRSEHNAVSGALVKLLHECIGSSVLTGKYCMLVMKCIWKVEISSQVVSLSWNMFR